MYFSVELNVSIIIFVAMFRPQVPLARLVERMGETWQQND